MQSENILNMWLGNISKHMYLIFQILAIGKFAESLNFVYLMKIQASGRPDLTAKRHFYELPFYIILQFILIHQYGLLGAAIGWCLWAILDLIYLYVISCKLSDKSNKFKAKTNISFIVVSIIFSFILESLIKNIHISLSIIISIIYIVCFMFCFYFYFMNFENKNMIKNKTYLIRTKLIGKL